MSYSLNMLQLFDMNRKQRPIDVATSQDMRFILSSANVLPCKLHTEIYFHFVLLFDLGSCNGKYKPGVQLDGSNLIN